MSSSAIAPLPVSEKIKTVSDIKLKPILSQGPSIEIKNISASPINLKDYVIKDNLSQYIIGDINI